MIFSNKKKQITSIIWLFIVHDAKVNLRHITLEKLLWSKESDLQLTDFLLYIVR